MTRIDFYVLKNAGAQSRERLACRLADKACGLGHKVYIHTESRESSTQMDRLLWTFRDDSFLPHALADTDDNTPVPVVIGHKEIHALDQHDVLINLDGEIPEFFSQFERVAELVEPTPDCLNRSRKHFRFFKERGYTLETHNL